MAADLVTPAVFYGGPKDGDRAFVRAMRGKGGDVYPAAELLSFPVPSFNVNGFGAAGPPAEAQPIIVHVYRLTRRVVWSEALVAGYFAAGTSRHGVLCPLYEDRQLSTYTYQGVQ